MCFAAPRHIYRELSLTAFDKYEGDKTLAWLR
jgi:hypothetical protein